MDYSLHNLVGNVGVVLIVGTYFLVQIGRISATGAPYVLCNGLGALCILYSLYYDFNLSAFLIEIVWLLISIVGLLRIWRVRRRRLHGAERP